MVNEDNRDWRQSKSLVTEKDIDPDFGLFTEAEPDLEADTAEEISEEFAAVPGADLVAKDSPIDPATPVEVFHGTDLLNGVGNHLEDETEEQ